MDRARDDFYRNRLKCVCLATKEKSYFGDKRYVAYVYRGEQVVIILDSPEIGNAAYIFLIQGLGGPEADAWITDAVRTKGDLASSTPEKRGTFRRRFIHAAGWQDRLERYLWDLMKS